MSKKHVTREEIVARQKVLALRLLLATPGFARFIGGGLARGKRVPPGVANVLQSEGLAILRSLPSWGGRIRGYIGRQAVFLTPEGRAAALHLRQGGSHG